MKRLSKYLSLLRSADVDALLTDGTDDTEALLTCALVVSEHAS